MPVLEGLLQGDGYGGPAAQDQPERLGLLLGVLVEIAQHVVPHRGDRAGQGRLALGHEAAQRLGLEPAVGHAERRAAHQGCVGESPRVGVEHRHDRQHPVVEGQPGDVARAHHLGVQPCRPVAVDHALGVAGRAARVAHRRGGPLLDLGPVELLGLVGEEVLVEGHLLAAGAKRVEIGGCGVRPGHQHVAHRLHLRQVRGQQADERVVDDHDLVLGVVGDVDELLREQADVQRVQHRAHRGDRQVGLEVLGVVPLEGPDPLVAVDAQGAQAVGQPRRAPAELGVGLPAGAVGRGGDDLGVRVHRGPVLHQRPDRERVVLHGAAHSKSSVGSGLASWGLPEPCARRTANPDPSTRAFRRRWVHASAPAQHRHQHRP